MLIVLVLYLRGCFLFLSVAVWLTKYASLDEPCPAFCVELVTIVLGRNEQSGTGKTAVFAMGILQMLDTSSSDTQALVLSPTRELAEQTQKVRLKL